MGSPSAENGKGSHGARQRRPSRGCDEWMLVHEQRGALDCQRSPWVSVAGWMSGGGGGRGEGVEVMIAQFHWTPGFWRCLLMVMGMDMMLRLRL